MPNMKKPAPKKPTVSRAPSNKTSVRVPAVNPKVAKRAPLETKRVGGIFAVPKKPKKTIY
jgi:hypothetical protein